MDFKQAMCEFGIAPEKIIEYTNQMKLSEVLENLPPRSVKVYKQAIELTKAIICYGDITYGEYLEMIENENKTKN